MKVVLSAFECEPGRGSEAGVGWGVAWSLAKRHRVHVLTTPRHRAAIERYLAVNPQTNLTFSYFDFSPRLVRLVVNSALWQIYYHFWQLRIASWARVVVETFDPDVIHHITYGRYWTPSPLWKLGKPFVWGPLGGGDFCPRAFLPGLSRRERFFEMMRAWAQRFAEFDPQLRSTAKHAAAVIASTPATQRRLETLGARKVVPLLQMALEAEFIRRETRPEGGVMFCSVGRLLGWKGHSLALRAFAAAGIPGAELVIVGDGPEKFTLVALAGALGITDRVTFSGAISRTAALNYLSRATALVHPSFHDQAPTVVFEAMALGTPVIALELGGLPLQLTAETGFLISAETPARTIAGMVAAMKRLAEEPGLRETMGEAAHRHVAGSFTWGKKAEQFEEIYRSVIPAR